MGARRALLLAAVASLAAAAVHELTPDNFDALVRSGSGPWIVEFYAPWCTHCKRLEPHYEAASRAKEAAAASFGRVDGAAHRSLLMRFGVSGFPTIFYIDAAGAVRPATINHSKQALITLAKNGNNATQPLAGLANPNGPAKMAVYLFLKYGEKGASPRGRRGPRGGTVGWRAPQNSRVLPHIASRSIEPPRAHRRAARRPADLHPLRLRRRRRGRVGRPVHRHRSGAGAEQEEGRQA